MTKIGVVSMVRCIVHPVSVHGLVVILHLMTLSLKLLFLFIACLALVLRVLFGQRWASTTRLASESIVFPTLYRSRLSVTRQW